MEIRPLPMPDGTFCCSTYEFIIADVEARSSTSQATDRRSDKFMPEMDMVNSHQSWPCRLAVHSDIWGSASRPRDPRLDASATAASTLASRATVRGLEGSIYPCESFCSFCRLRSRVAGLSRAVARTAVDEKLPLPPRSSTVKYVVLIPSDRSSASVY